MIYTEDDANFKALHNRGLLPMVLRMVCTVLAVCTAESALS